MLATIFCACSSAQNAWIWSYKTINYWFLLELEFWIPSQWQLIVHYEVRRVSYSWKSTSIIRFTYMIGYWRRKLILKLPREIQNQIKTITKTALILFLFHVMNSSKICTFWKMVKANVKTIFQKQSKNLSSSCSNCLLRKPMCLSFVTTQHTKSNQSPISIETEKLTFFWVTYSLVFLVLNLLNFRPCYVAYVF